MLHHADAELPGPVEIRVPGDAHGLQRLDIGAGHRAGVAEIGNLERPADAVEFAGQMIVILLRLEVGQHVPVGPGAVVFRARRGD